MARVGSSGRGWVREVTLKPECIGPYRPLRNFGICCGRNGVLEVSEQRNEVT